MILYFTGTGNSFFTAKILGADLNDTLISINDIFKNNKKFEFYSEKPFILVTPIYAWRIPKNIELFLKKGCFKGNNEFYIIATMGSYSGAAEKYVREIIERKGMKFMGFQGICMPDNYLVSYRMLSDKEAVKEIRKSIPKIHEIGKIISANKSLNIYKPKLKDYFLSGIVNIGFNCFEKNSKSFSVSEKCVKCKKCVDVCPVNNISLVNEHISFSNKCMFCLSCIHHCPVHAIDYKGKGNINGYYVCPPDYEIFENK